MVAGVRRLWAFAVAHQSVIGYLILLGALLFNLYAIRDTTLSTNRTVKRDIPRLEARIAELDKTIEDQNYVLNEQAVPAIIDMAKILTANGIDPPQVLLSPSQPPYQSTNP